MSILRVPKTYRYEVATHSPFLGPRPEWYLVKAYFWTPSGGKQCENAQFWPSGAGWPEVGFIKLHPTPSGGRGEGNLIILTSGPPGPGGQRDRHQCPPPPPSPLGVGGNLLMLTCLYSESLRPTAMMGQSVNCPYSESLIPTAMRWPPIPH